jgi:hypothetical protein
MGTDCDGAVVKRGTLRDRLALVIALAAYVFCYFSNVNSYVFEVNIHGRGLVTFESYKYANELSVALFSPINVLDRFLIRPSMWSTWDPD